MESCDRITQETLKSEAGVAPPVGFQDFCFKATFKTAGSERYYFFDLTFFVILTLL